MSDALPDPTPNVPIHTADLDHGFHGKGARFGASGVWLSRMAGAEQVHVNRIVLPPGKQNCPHHWHLREEEHFYVLSGRCVLRSGEERYECGPGDYVCFPAGTGVPHSFENPFDGDCTMLTIGGYDPHEVCVYPDSGKASVRGLKAMVPWPQENLDYWHGEAVDESL